MILAEEPPQPRVVVAVPQQPEARVVVGLVAAALPPRIRRRVAPEPVHQRPERIPVVPIRVPLTPVQQPPAVALRVLQVEAAGVLPVAHALRLADARRERGEVVGENITRRRGAVGVVGVVAAWIGLGQAQAQTVVGIVVGVAVGQRHARHPVFVVVGVRDVLAVQRVAGLVAVEVPAWRLSDPRRHHVMPVVGEGLHQRPVLRLGQAVAVVVVGVAVGERRLGAAANFAHQLIGSIVAERVGAAVTLAAGQQAPAGRVGVAVAVAAAGKHEAQAGHFVAGVVAVGDVRPVCQRLLCQRVVRVVGVGRGLAERVLQAGQAAGWVVAVGVGGARHGWVDARRDHRLAPPVAVIAVENAAPAAALLGQVDAVAVGPVGVADGVAHVGPAPVRVVVKVRGVERRVGDVGQAVVRVVSMSMTLLAWWWRPNIVSVANIKNILTF